MKKSRTKRLAASLLALALVFSMAMGMVPANAAADGTFKVESALADGKVELTVKAVNLKKLASVELEVAYDADTLEYTGYAAGPNADEEDTFVSVGAKGGVATIAYIDNDAADAGADGLALATLKFTVKEGVAATTSPVTLTLTELYAEATDDKTQDRADAANTAVRETYGDPADVAAFVPAEAVQVPIKDTPAPDFVLGDVTGEGDITEDDATYVLEHALGLRTLEEKYLEAADVTGEGDVTEDDATYILEYALGLRTSLEQ